MERITKSQTKLDDRNEFLGDKFYGAIVTEFIMKNFDKGLDSGRLTDLFAIFVQLQTQIKVLFMIDPSITILPEIKPKRYGDYLEIIIGEFYKENGYAKTYDYLFKFLDRIEVNGETITVKDLSVMISKKYNDNPTYHYCKSTKSIYVKVGTKTIFTTPPNFNSKKKGLSWIVEQVQGDPKFIETFVQ